MSKQDLAVHAAYWRQFLWFYVWKWTIPIAPLHRRTIRRANYARQEYYDRLRKR